VKLGFVALKNASVDELIAVTGWSPDPAASERSSCRGDHEKTHHLDREESATTYFACSAAGTKSSQKAGKKSAKPR